MPTVLHRLAKWAVEDPNAPAHAYKLDGAWTKISAKQFCDQVYFLALFLESRGFSNKDVGCIFSYNSSPWINIDLATLLTGAKSAGLYPNSSKKDIDYILDFTRAKVLSVQNKDYFNRMTLGKGAESLPENIEQIIVFQGDPKEISPNAISYAQAIEEGRKLAQAPGVRTLKSYLDALDPKDGALMIFTSGTTGNPKAALLSHYNLVFTSDRIIKHWEINVKDGSTYSFLPLCHIAEKLQNIGVAIIERWCVHFCTNIEKLPAELVEVQPKCLLAVPRVWEKLMTGVSAKIESAPKIRKNLANWALGVGAKVAQAKLNGKTPGILTGMQFKLANKLVISKVKKAIGMGDVQITASGAAALSPVIVRWFRSLGIYIYDDLGQTESTGMICLTTPGKDMAGVVGVPFPDTEMKIADDGEILTRGGNVFVGYYKNDKATKDAIDKDGWLHSGDIGELTKDGYLRVRGRKKEVLKTSGGKMTAPLPIEEELKQSKNIAQVCMVGDGRNFFTALIVPSEDILAAIKAKGNGSIKGDLIVDSNIITNIQSEVDKVNGTLARYEQIKRFKVLANEFALDREEITPTMKMKRHVIESNYKGIIDEMYAS